MYYILPQIKTGKVDLLNENIISGGGGGVFLTFNYIISDKVVARQRRFVTDMLNFCLGFQICWI